MHKNLVKFGFVVFELCEQTDRQTDRQTDLLSPVTPVLHNPNEAK